MPDSYEQILQAQYSSPNTSYKFGYVIKIFEANDAPMKKLYFTDLRASAKQLQNEINVFLTGKMEEDKIQSNQGTKEQAGDKSKDEEEEEENYGEEQPIEDEA